MGETHLSKSTRATFLVVRYLAASAVSDPRIGMIDRDPPLINPGKCHDDD